MSTRLPSCYQASHLAPRRWAKRSFVNTKAALTAQSGKHPENLQVKYPVPIYSPITQPSSIRAQHEGQKEGNTSVAKIRQTTIEVRHPPYNALGQIKVFSHGSVEFQGSTGHRFAVVV